MLLYVAATAVAVSAALVQESTSEGSKKQLPIYFISEAISGVKINYYELEKIAYAVLIASRKLKHYFLAHQIVVPLSYPLQEIFANKEQIGRISKWAL